MGKNVKSKTNSELEKKLITGHCDICKTTRNQMSISTSHISGIGYLEYAVSAKNAFLPIEEKLRNSNKTLPLTFEQKPDWAEWCKSILGKDCHGCIPVLRADWFIEHTQFKRFNELPSEAFIPHTQCSIVLFISHRWELTHNPDPDRIQAFYLSLFLITRIKEVDLKKVGIWYDYSVLPQKRTSIWEKSAFHSLIKKIPEIQALSQTIICGNLNGILQYANRGWCVLEYFGAASVEPDFISGGIPYRQALGHAIAKTPDKAVLQALAYLLLQESSADENVWTCPMCGLIELNNASIKKNHVCVDGKTIPDKIENIWYKLQKIERLLNRSGFQENISLHLQFLLKQRRRTKLDFLLDFEWMFHCVNCLKITDIVALRPSTQEEIEAIRNQLSICRDKFRKFLLGFYLEKDNSEVELLEKTEELNIVFTEPKDIPLLIQMMVEQTSKVTEILCQGNLVDKNGSTSAHFAAKWEDLQILKFLIEKNPKLLDAIDRMGNNLLHTAVFGYHHKGKELIKWLLEKQKQLNFAKNSKGEFPLHLAVHYADVNIVKMLLNPQSQIEIKSSGGFSLLHLVCWNPNKSNATAIAKFLLSKHQSLAFLIDNQKNTILHTAAETVNVPLFQLFFNRFPQLITLKNDFGDTPLHTVLSPNVNFPNLEADIYSISKMICQRNKELIVIENGEGLTPYQLAKLERADDKKTLALLKY